jgi:hypothetical protein
MWAWSWRSTLTSVGVAAFDGRGVRWRCAYPGGGPFDVGKIEMGTKRAYELGERAGVESVGVTHEEGAHCTACHALGVACYGGRERGVLDEASKRCETSGEYRLVGLATLGAEESRGFVGEFRGERVVTLVAAMMRDEFTPLRGRERVQARQELISQLGSVDQLVIHMLAT